MFEKDKCVLNVIQWMKAYAKCMEELLRQIDDLNYVLSYREFLAVAQVLAEHGYNTAIDKPISESEFNYRKIIRQFEALKEYHVTKPDETCLLITCRNNTLNYHQFLELRNLLAGKGHAVAIDIPIFPEAYSDFVNQKDSIPSYVIDILKGRGSFPSEEEMEFFRKGTDESHRCYLARIMPELMDLGELTQSAHRAEMATARNPYRKFRASETIEIDPVMRYQPSNLKP